jgi:hypothetical protein
MLNYTSRTQENYANQSSISTYTIFTSTEGMSYIPSKFRPIAVFVKVSIKVDSLLGNDREISKYTAAVTKQQLPKQAGFHGNNCIQQ